MATANTDPGAVIENGTPLTRNHWFDGKLLRADDLARDQDYHRTALRLANQAGGFGVVNGLEVALEAAELVLQPGLAVTPYGELLLLNGELRVGVEALLEATSALALRRIDAGTADFKPCVTLEAAAGPVAVPAEGLRIYRLTLELAQALCGFEDVVGNLCERACVNERQRPYQLEGVRLRAQIVTLPLPALPAFTPGTKHLRSRVASALFAAEDARITPLPGDGGVLQSPLWCTGADLSTGRTVTLGYLIRQSGSADFIDLWSGRRERMQTQAQGYWQRSTRMRPFADYIAQVAQFQCQLARALDSAPSPAPGDGGDCDSLRALVTELKAQIDSEAKIEPSEIEAAPEGDSRVLIGQATSPLTMQRLSQFSRIVAPLLLKRQDRLLLDRGIVEVPPAGFLPVHGDTSLQAQVQNLVGPGVQLRFCTAPLDAIGHLFEEAQHSARTALTPGLADPTRKPVLQVIVPDGERQASAAPGYQVALHANLPLILQSLLLGAKNLGVELRNVIGADVPPEGVAADSLEQALRAGTRDFAKKALPFGLTDSLSLPNDQIVARGAGRAWTDGALQFAFAVNGEPRGNPANTQAFEAAWYQFSLERDPFSADPSSVVAASLDGAERLLSEPAQDVVWGLDWHISTQLRMFDDPKFIDTLRDLAEAITGVKGGDLCGASWSRLESSTAHMHRGDGTPLHDEAQPVQAEQRNMFAQRVREPSGLRWIVAREAFVKGNVLVAYVFDLRAPNAAGERLLEAHIAFADKERKTAEILNRCPVARFLPDTQALQPGSAPRSRAESGLAMLDQALPDIAPDAAARQRLFGTGSSAGNLSGPHDWVLFRRPVDAQCAVPAPPPVAVAPPAPQIKTMVYRAAVARLLPGANAATRKQALDELQQGKIPDASTARLASAGTVSYRGGSLEPEEADVRLVAQFGRAGFASPCRLAGIFSVDAGAGNLALDRAKHLGEKLGAVPQGGVVWVQAPTELKAGEDGLMVFAVEPDELPPPPPAQVIHHRQRVLLLTKSGAAQLRQLLVGMKWESRAQALIDRLSSSTDLSRGFFEFEVDLQFSPDSVHLNDGAGTGLAALVAAVQANGGVVSDQITTLLRAAEDDSDHRKQAEAAGQALFKRLTGMEGAQVQIIGTNPPPTDLPAAFNAFSVLIAG